MKHFKIALVLCLLATLGGCAVYPAGPYYGPRGYYQPAPVYYGPAVGVYGGWHDGWHDHH